MIEVIKELEAKFYSSLEEYIERDSFILDIRSRRDTSLSRKLQYDYRWVYELTDKGETRVILRNEVIGLSRVKKMIAKARDFERPIVIVAEDAKHLDYVSNLLADYIEKTYGEEDESDGAKPGKNGKQK